MRIAGVDIDGVLADPTHRLHHLARRPKDWRAFFAAAAHDSALADGLAAVNRLLADDITIIYVTGRPDWLRRSTTDWLTAQGLPADLLVMRERGDFRPAPQVKLGIYRRLATEHDVVTILDDDQRVIDTLAAAGFPAHHADWFVAPEPEAAALHRAQDTEGRT